MNPKTLEGLLALRERHGTFENLGKAMFSQTDDGRADLLLVVAVLGEFWNELPETVRVLQAKAPANLSALVAGIIEARKDAGIPEELSQQGFNLVDEGGEEYLGCRNIATLQYFALLHNYLPALLAALRAPSPAPAVAGDEERMEIITNARDAARRIYDQYYPTGGEPLAGDVAEIVLALDTLGLALLSQPSPSAPNSEVALRCSMCKGPLMSEEESLDDSLSEPDENGVQTHYRSGAEFSDAGWTCRHCLKPNASPSAPPNLHLIDALEAIANQSEDEWACSCARSALEKEHVPAKTAPSASVRIDPERPETTFHRHVKTGGVYELLSRVIIEQGAVPAVAYRSVEIGDVWVRPAEEFFDGRFVALPEWPKEGEG